MEQKKAIYTVLIGEYDQLNEAPNFIGWDCFLLTDLKIKDSKGWKIIKINEKIEPKKLSRKVKIMVHDYLPNYDLYCYVDANIKLTKKPPNYPFRVMHPKRHNVSAECDAVILLGKDNPSIVREQYIGYVKDEFTDDLGLFQNGFFVRENSVEINDLHSFWWNEVQKHSYRDQLSLPYAVWKFGIKFENVFLESDIKKYYSITPHKPAPKVDLKIKKVVHHITPGRSDKNIGKAINDIVRNLPDEDWVCLRDIDTLPLNHTVFFEQCEILAGEYKADLIGCMTNRLGLGWQLYEGKISSDTNILNHLKISKELYDKHGNSVEIINETIGGLFMLFSKRLWQEIGGIPEGGISIDGKFFDWHLCDLAKKKGYKLGVAKGLYIFHMYRIEAQNPRTETKHLY